VNTTSPFTGLAEGEEQNIDFVRAYLSAAQEITLAPGPNQRAALQVHAVDGPFGAKP
jgi:hypothetical protein